MWQEGGSVVSVCSQRTKHHMGQVSGLSRFSLTSVQGQTPQCLYVSLPSSSAICLLVNSHSHASLSKQPIFCPVHSFQNCFLVFFLQLAHLYTYILSFARLTIPIRVNRVFHMFFISTRGSLSLVVFSLRFFFCRLFFICNKGKCHEQNATLSYVMLVDALCSNVHKLGCFCQSFHLSIPHSSKFFFSSCSSSTSALCTTFFFFTSHPS